MCSIEKDDRNRYVVRGEKRQYGAYRNLDLAVRRWQQLRVSQGAKKK